MFAQRIRPDELIDLLVAESYDPVLMKYCGHTKSSPKLGDFITEKARLGVTGTIANTYIPEGTPAAIPYLTTKQIDGLYAHLDGCKYITPEADKEWSHCRVPNGAIVLNKSGNVGAAAIVACAPYSYVNTVSDLINIRPRRLGADGAGRAVDSGYLVVFLNSPFGQSQLQRLSGGAVFSHVSLHAVPEIRIHEPDPLVQRYIGDKVRQAERLRERARNLELAARVATVKLVSHRSNAQNAIQNLLLAISGRQAERADPDNGSTRRRSVRCSRVAPTVMFGRLNAEAYQQEFLDNDRLLRASGWTLTRLGDLVTAPINNSIRGVTEHLSPDHRGVPMFRPADIDGLWMNDASAPRIGAAFEQEHAKARVQSGDIVLAIAGTVAAVARIGESVAYGNINGSSARVRLEAPLRGFVLLLLSSPFGQRELMRWAVGSVQKHLNLEDLTEVRVPVPPVEFCEPFESALQLSGRAREGSRALLVAARSLVERLIEGQVSEANLVAAQKALETGDRRADRDILGAFRQSDAPDAKPLIADLDGLYALLDESEENDA